MSQIALPLAWPERERDEDFVVGAPNEAAVRHLTRWATWPVPVTLLTGPRKSGRSLLARLFAQKTGGSVVDDAWDSAEETLFHAWNAATASRRPLLIVADDPDWRPALSDLASRLAATPRIAIGPADAALARDLIERALGRRGLAAPPHLSEWIAGRVRGSYVAIAAAVDAMDRAALAGRRRLTMTLAREAMRGLVDAGRVERGQGVIDA